MFERKLFCLEKKTATLFSQGNIEKSELKNNQKLKEAYPKVFDSSILDIIYKNVSKANSFNFSDLNCKKHEGLR